MLILRYSRLVWSNARRLFLFGGDYEDLVQEGMIGLLNAIRQYRQGDVSFAAYANTCIKNRMLSAVRDAASMKHSPLNDSVSIDKLFFDETVSDALSISPEDRFIDKERYTDCLAFLNDRLSPLEKRVLAAYLEGMSCSEIAEQVKKPLRSVTNAVQRIKSKAADIISRR